MPILGNKIEYKNIFLKMNRRCFSTAKRFWKTVSVKDNSESYAIMLDGIRAKSRANINSANMAYLLASEWASAPEVTKKEDFLMNEMLMDSASNNRSNNISELMKYLEFDTVKFFDDQNAKLLARQENVWLPLLEWFQNRIGSKASVKTDNVIQGNISSIEKDFCIKYLSELDDTTFAVFDRMVRESKSFIASLAYLEGYLDEDKAIDAVLLESFFQIEIWGEIPDAHELERISLRTRLTAGKLAQRLSQ